MKRLYGVLAVLCVLAFTALPTIYGYITNGMSEQLRSGYFGSALILELILIIAFFAFLWNATDGKPLTEEKQG